MQINQNLLHNRLTPKATRGRQSELGYHGNYASWSDGDMQ